MNNLLRRLRGVLGLSASWGILWALFLTALLTVVGIFRPQDVDPGEGPLVVLQVGLVLGLVAGFAFGALLSLAESGRALGAIPLGRAALWGVLAAALFPLATGREDQVFVMCPIGAALAVAAVAMARRASGGAARPLGILFGGVFVRDAVGPRREPAV